MEIRADGGKKPDKGREKRAREGRLGGREGTEWERGGAGERRERRDGAREREGVRKKGRIIPQRCW